MPLGQTILVVLSHAPSSGYGVSKRFEDCVGFYWKASQQQIYRELAKMQERGWVSYELVPQAGKPDKKIYAMTEAGLSEFVRWCGEPSEPTPMREDLLVKILASPSVPRSLVIQELRHRRAIHEQGLQNCLEMANEFQARSEPKPSEVGNYLTLRRGVRFERAWLDWCDEMLDFFENGTDFGRDRVVEVSDRYDERDRQNHHDRQTQSGHQNSDSTASKTMQ